jgi:hypothetical protein
MGFLEGFHRFELASRSFHGAFMEFSRPTHAANFNIIGCFTGISLGLYEVFTGFSWGVHGVFMVSLWGFDGPLLSLFLPSVHPLELPCVLFCLFIGRRYEFLTCPDFVYGVSVK